MEKSVKYVLVETVSQMRMRYVVEIPDNISCSPEDYASDTVSCDEAKEFSQKYLGETIVSTRNVSSEEILKMCDQDNDYAKGWSNEQKTNAFVTKIKD